MLRLIAHCAIALALVTHCCATALRPPQAEAFSEELLLQPLPGGKITAHFHFQSEGAPDRSHTLFPRVVDQLWALANVTEFHLTLTQGRWHADRWGRPLLPTPPTGAQLRARFRPGITQQDVHSSWGALAHGLSGTFCGSLNFLDSAEHISQPAFVFQSSSTPRTGWTYGALPREAVCTENLTPWLRLLPCRGAAGLAALLHGPTVFSSPFTSLAASLTAIQTGGNVRLRLAQTLTLLLPAGTAGDWSLGSLFGSESPRACPLAARSSVHVRMPWADGEPPGTPQQAAQQLGLSPAPAAVHTDGGHTLLEYPLPLASATAPLSIQGQHGLTAGSQSAAERPALTVHRHVTGRGEERGRIVLQLDLPASASSDSRGGQSAQLCVFQVVPWWAQLWLHTLHLTYDGQAAAIETAIVKRRIVPAEDRTSPAQLEACFAVPDGTRSVALSFDFQKAFLTVFEHPPDASRGLDLPAAVVTLLPAVGEARSARTLPTDTPLFRHMQDQHDEQVVSEGAVVQLAQPDFSMPYNVCCLTSTVLAVYLGAMLNALLQRETPELTPQQETAASRRRKLRVAGVVVVFGGAAVYLDKGLQSSLVKQLKALKLATL